MEHLRKVNIRETQGGTPSRPGVPFPVEPAHNVHWLGGELTLHCPMPNASVSSILWTVRHGRHLPYAVSVWFLLYKKNTAKIGAKHISKHMHSIWIGNPYLPLGRHVGKKHNYWMPNVNFTVLDQIHIPSRGGDWNKILLQCKMRWIKYLNARTPAGLNEAESF